MKIHPQLVFYVRLERPGAHGLASLSATQVESSNPGGLGPKQMVEADHPVDLGPREIQDLGDVRYGRSRDIAHLALDRVEDRQQRTGAPGMRQSDLADRHSLLFGRDDVVQVWTTPPGWNQPILYPDGP